MPGLQLQQNLLAGLAQPFTGEALFDALDDLVFFIKNERGEYVVVNKTLVARCGLKIKADLIGKTPEMVFPAPLGRSFGTQDRALLRSGRPMVNQLEKHLYSTGESGWCLTTKVPIKNADGQVVGLAGISRDLHPVKKEAAGYERVAAALQYLQEHLAGPLTLAQVAEVAGLSPFQLDQRIRKIFHLPTSQLIRKYRLDAAIELLQGGEEPISAISHKCGYCDQSAFTRQFKQTTGLTPGQYRRSVLQAK